MPDHLFQPEQLVKVLTESGFRARDNGAREYAHFVEKDSIVKIIEFQEEDRHKGYYIHAAPSCFKSSAHNGLSIYGYDRGVQFILENELALVRKSPKILIRNSAQLPEI